MTKGEDEILFLRFDLAKDTEKQCHLSEAGVNPTDGKPEQPLSSILDCDYKWCVQQAMKQERNVARSQLK